MRLLVSALALTLAAHSVTAQIAPVDRREIGQQVLENVPDASPELRESLRRYQNTRTSTFQDWLPDGSMLIATRFGTTAQLHRVAAPGAARTQLTFFDEPVGGAETIPGGDRVLFSKDRGGDEWFQLHLMQADGRDRPITEAGTRNFSPAFSPDGRTIVWARQKRGSSATEIFVGPADGSTPASVAHSADGSWSPLDVSPDARTVLVGRYFSIANSDLHLLDLETGRMRELVPAKDVVAYSGGEFTPDGRSVVAVSDRGVDAGRLVEIDVATGRETALSAETPWPVESFDLSPDGRAVAYAVNEDGWSRLYVRDLRTRRALPQPDVPKGVIGALKFSPDGRRLGFTLATARSTGDAWSADVATGEATRWTASELGGLRAEDLSEPTLVRFTSFDGLSVPAFVFRPATPRPGKLPVIVNIHGGPESQARPTWQWASHQLWANELGAAVIVPNVRGSDGYGKRYLALDNAEKREDSVKDVGALLDWIARQPDLDASRVAVTGGSYGGYMSLAVMTHYSDRLVGGVNVFGISNFKSFLQNTEAYRRDLRRAEYGDERDPAMSAVFDRISPLNNVARIGKPMLVMQGANDPRVPQSESDQIVRSLRERGVPTWYVLFKDEGHGFRKKPNSDRASEAQALFFRKVFGLQE